MRYNQLGNSDLNVSVIGLGTMTFGQQNTEAEAHAQLDRAFASGINFIDTAEMYPVPAKAETYGATETIIGNWIQKRQNRKKVILATKVVGSSSWLPHIRAGTACLDRHNIESALDQSLQRLQTDYIDLYQLHWPDRETNFFGKLGYEHRENDSTPINESLAALDNLVTSGKIRYIGVSNETPWGVMKYIGLSENQNLPRLISIQNPYNLLNRSFEIGLAEVAHREKVGLLAYSPLGFGTLTGKYLRSEPQQNARLTLFPQFERYTNTEGKTATQAYVDLSQKYGISATQMALAFINSRSFLSSNIIGVTTLEQLDENLNSINIDLTDENLNDIELIHQHCPTPCP